MSDIACTTLACSVQIATTPGRCGRLVEAFGNLHDSVLVCSHFPDSVTAARPSPAWGGDGPSPVCEWHAGRRHPNCRRSWLKAKRRRATAFLGSARQMRTVDIVSRHPPGTLLHLRGLIDFPSYYPNATALDRAKAIVVDRVHSFGDRFFHGASSRLDRVGSSRNPFHDAAQ